MTEGNRSQKRSPESPKKIKNIRRSGTPRYEVRNVKEDTQSGQRSASALNQKPSTSYAPRHSRPNNQAYANSKSSRNPDFSNSKQNVRQVTVHRHKSTQGKPQINQRTLTQNNMTNHEKSQEEKLREMKRNLGRIEEKEEKFVRNKAESTVNTKNIQKAKSSSARQQNKTGGSTNHPSRKANIAAISTSAKKPAGNGSKNQKGQKGTFQKSADHAWAMRGRKMRSNEVDEDFISASAQTAAENAANARRSWLITLILAVVLCILIVGVYFIGYNGFKGRYLRNTYVNGVNIGGVEIGKANNLIANAAKVSGITIILDNGEKVNFSGSKYGCKYTVPKDTNFGDENHKLWFSKYFTSTNYNINLDSSYSENALRALIKNYTWGKKGPTDAYIKKNSNGEYEIVSEHHGDILDNTKFAEYVVKQVKKGNDTIYVDKADCYLEPEVTSKDLKNELNIVNGTGGVSIKIKFGDETETISGKQLAKWVSINDDGQLVTDTSEISKYVSTLADKYNTYGKSLNFDAKIDGNITVPWTSTSIYGWELNEDTMTQKIADAIKDSSSDTLTPAWTKTGYGEYSLNDPIGPDYVEVDISEQHFWLFKNNEVVYEGDFVSGTETNPERATPRGICCIWNKVSDTYLGTYEVQGYHTHVDYWMPFNYVGCGFHDLNRGAYGGKIYLTNGSHGCLNLSKAVAKELFNSIDKGIPTIIHD